MLRAQEDTTAPVYRMPAPELVALVDQPITPAVSISPDQEQMLFMHVPGLMTIEDLAQPELRIAGMRINPRTNGPSRARYYVRLVLRPVAGGSQVPITGLPDKPKLGGVRWSPDASHFAFTNTVDDGIELWVAETASGAARRLTGPRLNAARGTPYYWLPDGKSLAVRLVPAGRGAFPGRSEVPAGPVIQENLGRVAPARTYQDLLKNPDDEALFEHHLLAQVALVDVESGSVREIGPAGLINRAQPSPDGQFLLVQAVHRPFSYLVPASRFPSRTDVWDLDGSTVSHR
jgi:dipeptidyl aminopeptidase/acylaminoacyl peptidase